MFKWKLERPLAIFDIESTGTSPQVDRIVELAIVRIHPDQQRDSHVFRINPQVPIPAEASRIHGISDADVKDCPTFPQLAEKIDYILTGCDLGGFNILRFDIPILAEEFLRAGYTFNIENRRVVDAQRIFHKREPRDLTAALNFYCHELHLGAHGAEADVDATIRVLEGQFERYADLPRDIELVHDYCNPRDPSWVDRTGKLRWVNGEITLNFGRKKGTLLKDLLVADTGFIKWMLSNDFPRDLKEILENAKCGKWPAPPAELPSADADPDKT